MPDDRPQSQQPATGNAWLANQVMDLFGLTDPRAKRRFTRFTVIALLVAVTLLSVCRLIWPNQSTDRLELEKSATQLCIGVMVALMGMQAVRNNEDAHKTSHDLRGELQPIKLNVEAVERQTNGNMTAKFRDVHERLNHLESPEFVARIAAAVARAVQSPLPPEKPDGE